MASTRPRRSVKTAKYQEMLGSDSQDAHPSSSDSNLSDESDVEHSNSPNQTVSSSLEVIHLPSPSEILKTQELIKATTAELAIVDSEYEIIKQKFQAIEAKRDAMRRQLLERKAYLAPVRAIPQEVLGLIFLFYTEAFLQSPWILMQVTRTWRATALSTRALWSKIMLTSPAWQKSGASRRMEGREVCGDSQQLDRALRRAGNAPLDITIALTNPHGRGYRKYDIVAFNQMGSHLASSRKCPQIHHLEFKGPRVWGFPASQDFSALKTLRYLAVIDSLILNDIYQTAKNITDVQLTLPANPIASYGFEDFIKCPTVLSLSLDATYFSRYARHGLLEKFRCALDGAPFITTLELSSFSHYDPSSPQAALRVPSLRNLTLNKNATHWAFDAPLLANLTLNGSSQISPGPPGSNHFPVLASLTIGEPDRRFCSPDYLNNLEFPPLHTLDLCFGKRVDDLNTLIAHQAALNPVIFCLRKTAVSTAALIQVIGSMDRLEELKLEDVPIKKDFFDFLASSHPDEILLHCPLLARLQVDLKDASLAKNKPIKPAAKKAVNARFKAGVPMEKWSIQYSKEQGWVDLLV